jgi:hypothetical protein
MKNKKQESKAKNKFYGYVRGSNDGVNKENQRKAILAVAKNRGIKVELTEITMSATKKISSRGINSLIARCNKGDTILVSEVARLARDVHELLGISKECRERGVSLEILNPPMVLDGSMMSNALVTILGMVAEMEKNTMSLRIKQSLEGKKSDLARQGYFLNKAGEKMPSNSCTSRASLATSDTNIVSPLLHLAINELMPLDDIFLVADIVISVNSTLIPRFFATAKIALHNVTEN